MTNGYNFQTYCWEIACERQVHRLRKIFYRQILRQEMSWYDLNDGGDLTTKLSEYVYNLLLRINNN